MKLSKKQKKVISLIEQLKVFFCIYPKYTDKEIYQLFKKSHLKYEDVAERFCRSKERAVQYCYGILCSDRLKYEIAKFFKEVIHDKDMGKN